MIALSLTLLAMLPQDGGADRQPQPQAAVPAGSVAWVVSGVTMRGGRLALGGLGLGDGGVEAEVRAVPASHSNSAFVSSGGVRMRALAAGAKLDFPSGAELMIDRRARIHLREGRATGVDSYGVQILMTDGSLLRVLAEPSGGRPLRMVQASEGPRSQLLWQAGRRSTRDAQGDDFRGRTYLALGDGRVLYQAARLGPMLVLDRALCPRSLEKDYPERGVVIAGDVLGRSLVEIHQVAVQRAGNRPKLQSKARALGGLAGRLFQPGTVKYRPSGATGEIAIPLGGQCRLQIDSRSGGDTVISLSKVGMALPLCEWHVMSNTTLLHMLDQPRRDQPPRFAMQGFDLRRMIEPLWSVSESPNERSQALRMLKEMSEPRGRGPRGQGPRVESRALEVRMQSGG